MGIILWIVFGAITGFIATSIMKSSEGIIMNIVLGVVGAVIGGFVMSLLGESGVTGFNLYSFLVAIVGAVLLIGVVRTMRRTA